MRRILRPMLALFVVPAGLTLAAPGCVARLGDPPPDTRQTTGPRASTPEEALEEVRGIDPASDGTRRQSLHDLKCEVPPSEVTRLLPVPAGEFLMGCNEAIDADCRPNEKPARMVYLDAFSIDETEVTQAQYYQCVKAGMCRAPVCWDPCNKANHPVGCVNRADAMSYCAWVGKRLPTEAEWEKAARGTDGLIYPYGNGPQSCDMGNIKGCRAKDDTMPVGSFPQGASPYGVLDMFGNSVEIVADFYDEHYYEKNPPSANPKGPATGVDYVGKGGSVFSIPQFQRASTRDDYDPGYFKWGLGFRCAR
jgi:formylglycine-generating enzyme required for sulfatase activity